MAFDTPSPPSFAVALETFATFAVLRAEGSITAATLPAFEHEIRQALGDERRSLILDFSAVSFISSAGLGALMVARGLASERGGEVLFTGVGAPIQKIFDLLDYGSFFRSFPTADEAAKALG